MTDMGRTLFKSRTIVNPIDDAVLKSAVAGRIHHRFIDMERPTESNARALIRALALEIERLRQMSEKRVPGEHRE